MRSAAAAKGKFLITTLFLRYRSPLARRNPQRVLACALGFLLVYIFTASVSRGTSAWSEPTDLECLATDHQFGPINPHLSLNARPSQANRAEAEQIMQQLVETYGSLLTYSDAGSVVERLHGRGGILEIRITFETFFKRPNKLRFAWTTEYSSTPGYKQTGVIWSDGTGAWVSYSVHGKKTESKKTLALAVASATGASYGTAHTIPRLLTDEAGGIRLDEMQPLSAGKSEIADGIECAVIAGQLGSGKVRRIWVGLSDHLIRRIQEDLENGSHDELRTNISMNKDIPDSTFTKRKVRMKRHPGRAPADL